MDRIRQMVLEENKTQTKTRRVFKINISKPIVGMRITTAGCSEQESNVLFQVQFKNELSPWILRRAVSHLRTLARPIRDLSSTFTEYNFRKIMQNTRVNRHEKIPRARDTTGEMLKYSFGHTVVRFPFRSRRRDARWSTCVYCLVDYQCPPPAPILCGRTDLHNRVHLRLYNNNKKYLHFTSFRIMPGARWPLP